ncbi:MAG: Copper tolerance protein [Labilithrix sp.]|nr:Copper tolerance protein [Labilithrix sp.]
MTWASVHRIVATAGFSFLAACASTSPKSAFDDVAHGVEQRSGQRVRWDRNTKEDAAATRTIDALLARELTVDGAVQVALLGNPRLRSSFEELSIGQADLVQAGLLANPVFTVGRTAWEAEHLSPNLFASVEQSFLDIVTLPLRKRVAAADLEATKLRVADEVLGLAAEVRSAFYTAQAAQQVVAVRRLVSDAAVTSADVARRQYEAGNMSDLALTAELALASRGRLDLARGEGEAAVAKEHVTRLMGSWGTRAAFWMSPRLPELPQAEVDPSRLESIAMDQRLDIGAARQQVEALRRALTLARTTRWTGRVSVNVEAGRLRGSHHVSLGPSVSLEVPLFDQRQAAIARLEAFERQAENNLEALAIDARSDVRAGRARMMAARKVVEEYGKVLVPLRETLVKLSQQQYDAMLLGVYQLLQAKQTEFDTYREYVEALRDYWVARSDLERAVGTRLDSPDRHVH